MMKLTVISPEDIVYKGEVQNVKVPGSLCPFEILEGHAPIITSLQSGILSYTTESKNEIQINGGFIEVSNNEIVACIEPKQ